MAVDRDLRHGVAWAGGCLDANVGASGSLEEAELMARSLAGEHGGERLAEHEDVSAMLVVGTPRGGNGVGVAAAIVVPLRMFLHGVCKCLAEVMAGVALVGRVGVTRG